MTAPIIIELAGAPQGKGRPRFVRSTGIAFTPEKTRGYEAALRLAGQEAMAGRAPIEGPISITIDAMFPVPSSWSRKKREDALSGAVRPQTKPDVDNLIKTIDALNEVAWRDDKQVVTAVVSKTYSDRPRLVISIRALHDNVENAGNIKKAPRTTARGHSNVTEPHLKET